MDDKNYSYGACVPKHHMSKTPEHGIWRGIQQRCYNPKRVKYKIYGARGIIMCDRWLGEEGFMNFYNDMGPRPSKDHSVERLDNDGNYEPSNCRWATRKEQCRNRTTSCMIEYKGQIKTQAEWVEITGLNQGTISTRYRKG